MACDDERAISYAGIVLAATLGQRPGIEALVDVCLGDRPRAANVAAKVMTLISGDGAGPIASMTATSCAPAGWPSPSPSGRRALDPGHTSALGHRTRRHLAP